MPQENELTDRIYEAAFVPELWSPLLEDLAIATGSASGSILVFSEPDQPPRYRTTSRTEEALHTFVTTDQWRQSQRVPFLFPEILTGQYARFFYANDLIAPHRADADAVQAALRQLALDDQITTVIAMPTQQIVSFTFERQAGEGRHEAGSIALLDRIRPHASRSGMISARLGLERAQATVSTLEALGLPAAVLNRTGRVLATNGLLESVAETILPIAFGGLAIASAAANKLFQQAIAHALANTGDFVRSVPVPAQGDQPALVVHVLPVFRAARDLLFGSDILVAVTRVDPAERVPAPPILMGLFDLSPSEARLATALASGKSVRQAAAEMGIGFGSARTYLAHVFSKTGTNQQSQLVSLLKSAQPVAAVRQG